jgi:hypothetical protein
MSITSSRKIPNGTKLQQVLKACITQNDNKNDATTTTAVHNNDTIASGFGS